MARELAVVDFETHPIVKGSPQAPKPVGVGIWLPGREPLYHAWGHPSANNCTEAQGRARMKDVYRNYDVLFHNGMFDQSVAHQHMDLPFLSWDRYHDTLFALFLKYPHARDLKLKPSAERILGLAPEEKNEMEEWMVRHGFIKKVGQKDAGEHIWRCPGDVVGRYGVGDLERTAALHNHVLPDFDDGMMSAYERELRLMPILARNQMEGMRIDLPRLERDVVIYRAALAKADNWLRKFFGRAAMNLDSNDELADALDAAGLVTEWAPTKTGKRSTSKANMPFDKIKNVQVASAIGYRNRLATVLSNSMEPWLTQAREFNGFIYTNWNQVKGDQGGTRTGRMSCSRFMNVTKDFMDKNDGYAHPAHLNVPVLPLVRRYIMPDSYGKEKGFIAHRDYSQQELRIFAHFEDGKMCAAYHDNPRLDFHAHIQGEIARITGQELHRGLVKILNLGMLYGQGIGSLAARMRIEVAKAKRLKEAQKMAIPGLAIISRQIKERVARKEPIRTWGGRLYFCEPPAFSKKFGKVMSYEYKLLNYLCQGSAADCTKEAIIRYDDAKKDGRFMVSVHDESNISVPARALKSEMKILKQVMESIEFNVPMLTDGKVGPSWGELKPYQD